MINLYYDLGEYDDRDIVCFSIPKKAERLFKKLLKEDGRLFVGTGDIKEVKTISALKYLRKLLIPIRTKKYFEDYWEHVNNFVTDMKKNNTSFTASFDYAYTMEKEEYVKTMLPQEYEKEQNKKIQKVIDLL